MRECHCLDAHLNRHRVFTGSLEMISKMMSVDDETAAAAAPSVDAISMAAAGAATEAGAG
jgi:hypothetical protein